MCGSVGNILGKSACSKLLECRMSNRRAVDTKVYRRGDQNELVSLGGVKEA